MNDATEVKPLRAAMAAAEKEPGTNPAVRPAPPLRYETDQVRPTAAALKALRRVESALVRIDQLGLALERAAEEVEQQLANVRARL